MFQPWTGSSEVCASYPDRHGPKWWESTLLEEPRIWNISVEDPPVPCTLCWLCIRLTSISFWFKTVWNDWDSWLKKGKKSVFITNTNVFWGFLLQLHHLAVHLCNCDDSEMLQSPFFYSDTKFLHFYINWISLMFFSCSRKRCFYSSTSVLDLMLLMNKGNIMIPHELWLFIFLVKFR